MSEYLLAAVLVGCAAASLSRLVTRETGLFGCFVKLRNLFPKDSEAWQILNCPLCFGVYASTGLTIIVMLIMMIPVWWFFLLVPASLGVAYALLGLAAMIQ